MIRKEHLRNVPESTNKKTVLFSDKDFGGSPEIL